jgi:hypothetical protein
MPKGLAFWIVYLMALLFTIWAGWPWGTLSSVPVLVLFFLIGILGWAQFGAPIQ